MANNKTSTTNGSCVTRGFADGLQLMKVCMFWHFSLQSTEDNSSYELYMLVLLASHMNPKLKYVVKIY